MQTLQQTAYDFLCDELMAGEFPPGSLLPEKEIASRLGMSRMPVREAISRLRHEGVVDSKPRAGWYVVPVPFQEIDNLIEVRIALETRAAAGAARYASPAELDDLARNLSFQVKYGREVKRDPESLLDRGVYLKFVKLDMRFHEKIAEMSRNVWIERLGRFSRFQHRVQISKVYLHYRRLSQTDPNSTQEICRHRCLSILRTIRDHRRIYDLIRHHEADGAADAMERHLKILESTVREEMQGADLDEMA